MLVSGSIGDHGVAIMSQRENLSFDAPIVSDTAALNGLIARSDRVLGPSVTNAVLKVTLRS